MDKMDKEILNEIQWTFPLVPRPYSDIAKKFQISDEDLMQRLRALKEAGIVRQLSAIFDTRRLGYKSALVAMAIDADKLDNIANQVNKHPRRQPQL
ncbi:Siroheme decarboxylase AhbA, alternate heme biosynthesis pathway [Candidatus Nitrosotalea sp. TS]|nr:Siroheme decarboxylase AhbA, alternate heme biosynthesis pathway [Candidatus Nitrosotalea sp. TS]